MKRLFISTFFLILGFCSFAFGQTAELRKFEFMKGEFKSRGGNKDILKGNFSKDGQEFSWVHQETFNDELGSITYDEASKSFRLKEMIYRRVTPIFYQGTETNEGFHFYEINENGKIIENGEEVLIRQLEPGIFNIEHFYHYLGKENPKRWIPSRYYSKNLSDEQLAKHTRLEIGKLDYLVGKFVSDDDTSQFTGKFTDGGKKLVWNFTSTEKTSKAVITYDFHWDQFTFEENIKPKNSESHTIKYVGRINEDKKIAVYSRIEGKMTKITFSSFGNDKILIQFMKYDKTPNTEITYTKIRK